MTARRHVDIGALKALIIGPLFLALFGALGGNWKSGRSHGRHLRAQCIIHEGDGLNLSLNLATGGWRCHSECGRGGDVFDLVMAVLGLSFGDAVAWLADWAGLPKESGATQRRAPRYLPPPAPRFKPKPDSDPTRVFLKTLWSFVDTAVPRPDAVAYLEDRNISVATAHAVGVRDLLAVRDHVRDLIVKTPKDVLAEAGLFDPERGLWKPLVRGVVHPEQCWRGLAFPVWSRGECHPVRLRYHCFKEPWPGATRKWSPYSTPVPANVLGFGGPGRIEVEHVGDADVDTLVIVEGDCDWLSAVEVLGRRAAVIAVCGAPQTWPENWPSFLDLACAGIKKVAVLVHCGGTTASPGHGDALAQDISWRATAYGMRVARRLVAEGTRSDGTGGDLNDRHRRGELGALLDEVLGALQPSKVAA